MKMYNVTLRAYPTVTVMADNEYDAGILAVTQVGAAGDDTDIDFGDPSVEDVAVVEEEAGS